MKILHLKENLDYDGSQLCSLWAYQEFELKEDSLIIFRGRCNVKREYMVDIEDRKKGERIHSPDMMHIIVEHFDSTDLKTIYLRQRLLVTLLYDALKDAGYSVKRAGDDIYSGEKKLTVSIASVSSVSGKIHLGVNVKSDEYGSLEGMGLGNGEDILKGVAGGYQKEILDIEKDLRKSRPLEAFM